MRLERDFVKSLYVTLLRGEPIDWVCWCCVSLCKLNIAYEFIDNSCVTEAMEKTAKTGSRTKVAVNAWFEKAVKTGSGQYTRQLIEALGAVAPEFELELVAPASHQQGNLAKVAFEQVTFPRAAKRMNADLAFVPYWAPPLYCPVPVITTIHDVIPLLLPAYRGGPQHRAYAALVRAGAANASAILTDSENSKQDIVRLLPVPESRITVVPLAARPEYTPAIPQADMDRIYERYTLPERYMLYLGNFDARKNIETLLQVMVWCGESVGAEFPLVINGTPDTPVWTSGGESVALQHMIDTLDVADVVRPIGRVAEEDKPALYAGARVFLFPSLYEGFGLPALEAMACGTPVIGSNASSIPEVVGNAGILVEPNDARRMAGAVIALCDEDDYHARMRQRSLLRAAQFSWQRTALETAAVFRKLRIMKYEMRNEK